MVQHFLSLALLISNPALAEAGALADACHKLVNGNPELTRKCEQHAESYELKPEFVRSCTDFHQDPDIRTRCLKSGANQETFSLCKGTGWSTTGTLTCLRSYPTKESLSACKKFATDEESQIRCLRLGRDVQQMAACTAIGNNQAARFACLQLDVPAYEAQACHSRHQTQERKFACMENLVAERDGEYWRDQNDLRGRSLASEKLVSQPLKMKKSPK